jgi:hypothetical protein
VSSRATSTCCRSPSRRRPSPRRCAGCSTASEGRPGGAAAALLPALVAAAFAAGLGTLAGGVGGARAAAAHALLLGGAALAGAAWPDPLRLGAAGRFLPPALWAAVLASAWASPAPRAGLLAALFLPAFFLLPAAVARVWRHPASAARGTAAIAAAVALVAGWALWDLGSQGAGRAAAPLGHHNLLAAWLVPLLPLALLPLRAPGAPRWIAGGAGLLAAAALVATRSLLGALALGVEAALALVWWRRGRRWLVPAALLALLTQVPRLAGILAGEDPSTAARAVYLAAGWRGFLARPLLGWGPGTTAWTIGGWLRPVPGVNPPGEVVGDLHSLPLELLYTLGATGSLLAVAAGGLFLWRRRGERRTAVDPRLLAAGWIGLAGAATAALGGAPLAVTALPVVWTVAAGATLAAAAPPPAGAPPRRVRSAVPVAYAVVVALVVAPRDGAHLAYDRAVRAGVGEAAAAALADAVRLDPSFPLYRARLAWLRAEAYPGGAAAREARAAAASAGGLSPLWLAAGASGRAAGEAWTAEALARACALDPLGALAPFHRLVLAPEAPAAPEEGARALLGEPRLLASPLWVERPALLAAVGDRLRRLEGVDRGWLEALVARLPEALAPENGGGPGAPAAEVVTLGLEMDADPATAFSLYAFRRRPWPATLAPVALRGPLAARLQIPPATTLPTTRREALAMGCGGG